MATRVVLVLNLLELRGTPAFCKYAKCFVTGEAVGEVHVDYLFKQLHDDSHTGNLHPELQLLKQELEREGMV